MSSTRDDTDAEVDLESATQYERPHYPNQSDLSDLIWHLGLTKSNSELLTSRLKKLDLLHPSIKDNLGKYS